ncbi:hypothetical protein [Streptomyces prunicolor]|uniref:hypothetical protein n=1 Tax=Streptomyces prunicolor TaxID=67348 RepID=UPI00039BBB08|nr:hypothetical protein [Streptomyces prunicolor]
MSGGGSAGGAGRSASEAGRSAGRAGKSAGGVRELAALSGALAMTLALMVWGASDASAGGPTSVLVTSPESGRARGLYYSDEQYGKLQQLLGPEGKGSRDKPPEADLVHAHQINVTWLAHDISPWRIDRVFPVESRPQAVWIHTAADVPENTNLNGYWHRAEHPAQLRALFDKLGVLGKGTGDGYSGIFPAPWESTEPAPAAVAPDSDTGTGTVTGTGAGTTTVRASLPDKRHGTDWWWAIPGAAAGAVLALGLRPFVARLPLDRWRKGRDPGPGPRQELRDV